MRKRKSTHTQKRKKERNSTSARRDLGILYVIIEVLLAKTNPLILFSKMVTTELDGILGLEIRTASVVIIVSTCSRPAALMVDPVSIRSTFFCFCLCLCFFVCLFVFFFFFSHESKALKTVIAHQEYQPIPSAKPREQATSTEPET